MAEQRKKKTSSKDGGWAWMVCAAITLYNTIVTGTIRSLGILFLQFSDILDDQPSKIAWIGTTFTLSVTLLGPVMGRLEDEVSHKGLRFICFICCPLAVLGFAIAAWSQQVLHAVLSFGLLSGLSFAALDPAVLSFIGIYFEERRDLACGIMFAGCSLGGLVIPPLLTLVYSWYGCRGSLMTLAGIWLHILIVASICRPLENEAQEAFVGNKNRKQIRDENPAPISSVSSILELHNSVSADKYDHLSESNTDTGNPVQPHVIQESLPSKRNSVELRIDKNAENDAATLKMSNIRCAGRFGKEMKEYGKFLCRPSFLMLMVTFALAGLAGGCSYFLLPLLVDEQGMSEYFASQIIMVSSVVELISKPIFGLISNRLRKKKVYLLQLSYAITAAFGILLIFQMSSLSFIIYSTALGMFGVLFMQFIIPMLMELSDKSNISRVAGLFPFLMSIGPTIGQPLLSWLHDLYGNHKVGLLLLTASYCLTAIIFTLYATLGRIVKQRKLINTWGTANATFDSAT